MVTRNKDLMKQAREALSGRWGLAVGTTFVYLLIVVCIGGTVGFIGGRMGNPSVAANTGSIVQLLLSGAFALGLATFFLALARREDAKLGMLFSGFNNFLKATGLFLLMCLFIILWSLLLIIPGIIAAISYQLAFFIMADDPNVGVMEAINRSKKMMYGYKWKFFCLNLRFIGWCILGCLTLFIGFLWIIPYMEVSFAKFYDDVKANYVEGV